jgi:glycerol-3-phosphate acyltransferase PlsY
MRLLIITIALILLAYLLGSVPFSQLIAWWRSGVDLYKVGEGNVGSRNVWHIVGPSWGLIAAVLDTLKGLITVAVANLAGLPILGVALCGVAVLFGHQYPIFLRGQGGKGLATGLGVLLGVSPLSAVAGLALLGLAYLLWHDFNPALALCIVSVILLPFLFRQPLWVPVYALILALLCGAKKLVDRPHEHQVWARAPWRGTARPGMHRHGADAQRPRDTETE